MARRVALAALVALGLAAQPRNTGAFTILVDPPPFQAAVHENNGVNECGGAAGATPLVASRGEQVRIAWQRNNHFGGFVQVSAIPADQFVDNGRDQIAAFDDANNMIYLTCFNRNCAAENPDQFGLGPDFADGRAEQKLCSSDFMRVPSYLEDGDYVIKVAFYGMGDSFNVAHLPLISNSNCFLLRVQGGGLTAKPPSTLDSIQWDLVDDSINTVNNKGINIGFDIVSEGHCIFIASNTHNGCRGDTRRPNCVLEVAEESRCGANDIADSFAECSLNDPDVDPNDILFDYVVGMPPFHVEFTNSYLLLARAGIPVRSVGDGGRTSYRVIRAEGQEDGVRLTGDELPFIPALPPDPSVGSYSVKLEDPIDAFRET